MSFENGLAAEDEGDAARRSAVYAGRGTPATRRSAIAWRRWTWTRATRDCERGSFGSSLFEAILDVLCFCFSWGGDDD